MNAVFEKFASENKVYTAKDGTKRIYINASELLDDCSKAESRKTIIIAEFTDGTVSAAFDGGSNAGQKARIARAIAQKLQEAEEAKAEEAKMFTVIWGYKDVECGSARFDSVQEAEVFYWDGIRETLDTPAQEIYWSSLLKDGEILRHWDDTNIGATLIW